MKFETPTECSLAQAALFVADKRSPLKEDWYQAAALHDIDMPAHLIYALKSQQLVATGTLYQCEREYLHFLLLGPETSTKKHFENVQIPSSFWNMDCVDAARSQLEVDSWIAWAEYDDPSLLDESDGSVLVFAGIKVSTFGTLPPLRRE
jgi:hypothetical protein